MKYFLAILAVSLMILVPLVCYGNDDALALPSGTWSKEKQYQILETIIHECYPGHEIILVNQNERLVNNYSLHTPLIFKGMKVYLRRSA